MTLRELVAEVNAWSVGKGWRERPRTVGDQISLMHSELSEALEEFRAGHPVSYVYYNHKGDHFEFMDDEFSRGQKPEGIPIELADCIIRIADFCGEYDIDLEQAIERKLAYNRTRPHRHGGKEL